MEIDTSLQIRQLDKIHRIAGIGYWIYNYNSNEMWWSNITYTILGYKKQNFSPNRQNLIKHIHPEDLEFFLISLQQMIKQAIEIEFRFFKNGELRLGKITGEVYDNKEDGLIEEVLFQDITEIKIKEFEIAKAWNKAQEAENLKNSFLANMSHELRTPLNSIIGFSELLETSSTDTNITKFASTIKGSGMQLLRIIEDLLKVSMLESRVSKPTKRNFHLNEMLLDIKNNSLELLKTNNKEHIDLIFNFDLDSTNDIINSDQIKIRSIFKNIIHNAIKFTETGSISCCYKIIKDTIHFSVTDTGVGIPSKYENRVFKRFRQADESGKKHYGGTGLGMYISRLELELLGGKIWFVSENNLGTTINFTIPNILTSENQFEEDTSLADYNWENYTVIIAEDQITNFKILEAYLQKTNINILWAKNGEEVINACLQNPEISIVLMDINMPQINGLEATTIIKEKRPNLTVIAQTAYALIGDKEKSLEAGCSDHLTKPIKKSDLLESMAKFLP
ncbi:MAG: hypothetical protein COC06_04220 [Bacteroidales bacterium]|nr:MAG: hypothetical protein COC06_04220 [Bacteroidales bacterium]